MSNRVRPNRDVRAPGQLAEHIVVGEHFVNAKVHSIVQAIQTYSEDIEVQWLPYEMRTREDGTKLPAFKIVYHDPNAPIPFVLFHVMDESEFDERVLMRIMQNDQRNSEVTMSDFEAFEAAQRRIEHQKWLDGLEEAEDLVKHIIATKLNTYKVNDDLIIKDGIPFNAAHMK
jgi:hypothetical protein